MISVRSALTKRILNKPGRLTPEEFKVIQNHSMLGAKMLHDLDGFAEQPLLQTAYEIAAGTTNAGMGAATRMG